MNLDYLRLPSNNESFPRPILNVRLPGVPEAPLACLVDSGAVYNRFPREFAEAGGIGLEEPDATDTFWIGGAKYSDCPIVRVQLAVASFEWEAPVCFVSDWQHNFGILGHEGFFRWFDVCFHAADEQIALELAEH